MDEDLKISVVCPTYNSAFFVFETLKSIVMQTAKPYEIIISDDGSTDETCAIVEKFFEQYPNIDYHLIRNVHLGPGATRNAGIKAAKGNWIAFIDSDDIWVPHRLSVIEKTIVENSKVSFICNDELNIKLNGEILELNLSKFYDPQQPLPSQLYKRNFFTTSSVCCKKALIEQVGFFDEDLMSAQDYDLWLKLAPYINVFMIRQHLTYYVDRPGNITSSSAIHKWKNITKILWRYKKYSKNPFYFLYKQVRILISILKTWVSEQNKNKKYYLGFLYPALLLWKKVNFFLEPNQIVVLSYHDIAPQHVMQFKKQITYISKHYNFINYEIFSRMSAGEIPIKGKNILLTFDDGFYSNAQVSREILDPLGIKACFFIVTDLLKLNPNIDRKTFIVNNLFDGSLQNIGHMSFNTMNIPDLLKLVSDGHFIGSHTNTHRRLSSLKSTKDLNYEIIESAKFLEKELSESVTAFAYPFGSCTDISQEAIAIAENYYQHIFSGVRGVFNKNASKKIIFRQEISPVYPLSYVRFIVEGGLDWLYRKKRKRLLSYV